MTEEVGETNKVASTDKATGPPAPKPAHIYILPKRLLVIIRQLFPTASYAVGGTIAWQSFLNMMAQLRFAIETNGGSAFAFIFKGQGRIVVHRPHPDSTLQSFHLRNIVTELENQFGWGREWFECA